MGEPAFEEGGGPDRKSDFWKGKEVDLKGNNKRSHSIVKQKTFILK